MIMRICIGLVAAIGTAALAQPPTVRALPTPNGGLQPQAVVAADGTLHLLYFKGDPKAGDLFYTTRPPPPRKPDFAAPIRVNSQPGSAVAIGNNRGGQLALGKNGRVHIAWNGSGSAEPKGPKNPAMPADSPHNGLPMLYTRLTDNGDAFEPQRNLMTSTSALDGGGSIAATDDGHVYVAFHADPAGASGKSETERRVYLAASLDDGATFAAERPQSRERLGACGCCGLKATVDARGHIRVLFRAAAKGEDRDAILLSTVLIPDHPLMQDRTLDPWRLRSCPMSTFAFAHGPGPLVCAWETAGNVFFAVPDGPSPRKTAAPGEGKDRKYPALAIDTKGRILLAWTEGMTWAHEGTAHWQLFNADGTMVDGASGQAGPVPAWSLVSVIAEPDGSFTVLY